MSHIEELINDISLHSKRRGRIKKKTSVGGFVSDLERPSFDKIKDVTPKNQEIED